MLTFDISIITVHWRRIKVNGYKLLTSNYCKLSQFLGGLFFGRLALKLLLKKKWFSSINGLLIAYCQINVSFILFKMKR